MPGLFQPCLPLHYQRALIHVNAPVPVEAYDGYAQSTSIDAG
jgi:hypothetical protein